MPTLKAQADAQNPRPAASSAPDARRRGAVSPTYALGLGNAPGTDGVTARPALKALLG